MSEQSVTITNRRQQRLAGVVHGELGAEYAAILCHGMLSTKDSPKHVALARRLAAAGVATVRFDFAGRGESDGTLFDLSYSNEIEDLDAVVEWLWARGVKRIGIFGSSMGGAVALLTASRDERVVAVATMAAVAHPGAMEERYPTQTQDWRDKGYIDSQEGRIGVGFLDDAQTHDVSSAVSVLLAPILVVHGTEDEIVPTSDAHDIACAARRASLLEVEGADHRFTRREDLEEALSQIESFLTSELRG
ncbi:MAG: alpha/beta hydrolase [Myxococcota bacterium]